MSKAKTYKDSSIYLKEMVLAAEKIAEYLSRTTEEEFLKKLESYDAICMQFAQNDAPEIADAARRILKKRYGIV